MATPGPAFRSNASSTQQSQQGPRRRLSYLIPPPASSQLPPFLALPSASQAASSRKGSPNPLIFLAQTQSPEKTATDSRTRSGSLKSLETDSLSSSSSHTSSIAGGSGLQQHHQPQRHPEHTLGVTALAIDASTVIDSLTSSKNPYLKRPAGILYSGGRDGLVASWELGLPFKRREDGPGYTYDSKTRKLRKSQYRPRWSEEVYGSEDEEEEDLEEENSGTSNEGGVHDSSSSDEGDQDTRRVVSNSKGYQDLASAGRTKSHQLNKSSNGVLHSRQNSLGLLSDKKMSRIKDQRGTDDANGKETDKAEQILLPYEHRWRIDEKSVDDKRPPSTAFRQAHRGHTDWVNDIVLCNLNQTLISASSDRSIRIWNPHDPHRSMIPASLGSHNDYVKCLAMSRESAWLASGGFDKKLKVWDVHETREAAILEFAVDASIYSVATNAQGSALACGSPEKVVRIYDPRAASSVARLVGHADNVRSLLVSEDGRHVLSASSDATVKLWSVSMQRCLHTFTYHSDSVWSLFSSHPHLEIFYSGDRSGAVCKVDFTDCGDIASEGECVILSRNRDENKPGTSSSNDGINRIVAIDDTFLWTASGVSSISRWRDIPPKLKRQGSPAGDADPVASSRETHGLLSTSPSSDYQFSTLTSRRASEGAPLNRTISSERSHSVAFAFQPSINQRSAPTHPPLLPSRPSSLRISSSRQGLSNLAQSSSLASNTNKVSSPEDPFSSPIIKSEADSIAPSLNGVPLESLIPLFTSNDPYSLSSGYAMRSGGHGYSASVLSLHRTTSRSVQAATPFGPGFGPASSTPPSSNLAAPRAPLSSTAFGRAASPMPNAMFGTPSHRSSSIAEEDEENNLFKGEDPKQNKNKTFLLAQQEFEDRETALDGVPLRSKPDDIIRGRHGLVRAELLNDRRTVVSLDTLGEIAVWDIILGGCIGRFEKSDLRQRMRMTILNGHQAAENDSDLPEDDVLEFVRREIEGEAVVASWCTVETKTGHLTVHIEQNRAFDAEVYLDEAGVPPKSEYRVDQRLNLGKWVLRNLFDAFIVEEVTNQTRSRSGSTASSIKSTILPDQDPRNMQNRSARPSHITIPEPAKASSNTHENGSDTSWTSHFSAAPGGFAIALATPAMTSAVPPNLSDLAAQVASPRLVPSSLALATIPQSPIAAGSVPSTPLINAGQKDGDYFSRPKGISSDLPSGTITPRALPMVPTTPSATVTTVPKMSKMSRFKSFGKKDARKDLTGDTTPLSIAEEKLPLTAEEEREARLTPAERAQSQLLQAIFSHPLQPSPWIETPPIRFVSELPIMVGEESHDAGAWATIYRGLTSKTGTDANLLEMYMPSWLLEYCLHGIAQTKDQVKIAFVMEPWGGPDKADLPALPSGNARLSATRMLRMRKACHYIAEKLQLESWQQRQQYQAALDANIAASAAVSRPLSETQSPFPFPSAHAIPQAMSAQKNVDTSEEPSLLPEDEVELLCNDQIVPLNITLAACSKYVYGKSGDMMLFYRRRQSQPLVVI